MADMGKCDEEVFANGTVIAIMAASGAEVIEKYIKGIAEKTSQRVDWHYAGGRAVVKALGDLDAVKKAMQDDQPEGFQFMFY